MSDPLPIGVLASGAGTNLQALIDQVHGREARIVGVASNRPDAQALDRAERAGIDREAFPLGPGEDRSQRDARMAGWLCARGARLVVLAGYMQLLGPSFLDRFPDAVINVHPSLLPAFPGLQAIEQALAYGSRVFGVSVHFVDDGVDTGPLILQQAVAVPDARRPQEVLEALRPVEHALLPEAVRLFAGGVLGRDPENPRRVVVAPGTPTAARISSASVSRVDATPAPSAAAAPPGGVRIRRALLSVSDKRGIVDLARGLADLGVELVSTGGTAAELVAAGIAVRAIDDFTGFPEIMDGRVKTLHPRLYAGLLAVRDNPEHLRAAAEQEIEFVDMVCVNLYPFERTVARRQAAAEEVVENIDIGGPTMIRAAAKNHAYAAAVVRPESYDAVLDELRESDGLLSMATREALAAEAFAYTARYEAAIARWFAEKAEDFPSVLVRAFEKVVDLSYGENPHQRAAYYRQAGARADLLSMVRQHQGKELSFNNLLDLDAVRLLIGELDGTAACAIVKHNNPCGCAVGATALEAYRRAFACDPMSAFGGVIAFNGPVDGELATALGGQFLELVVAPSYTPEAVEVFAAKPNVRVLENAERRSEAARPDFRQVIGGLLVQDRDLVLEERAQMRVATSREPTEAEWADLIFSWRICKHVRSNAIVIARDGATAGIGAGQMSRVDSVRLAVEKSRLESLAGASLASDAYFPFADGPELAIEAGVTAIIQPGGSIRDDEVIAAAEAAGVAMVLTARRHFRH